MGPGRPIEVRPVDLGLPSGIMWSPVNVDVTQANGFALRKDQYACSYVTWGNIDGHNTDGASFAPFRFAADTYAETPGASIEYPGSIDSEHDIASQLCGSKWRIPSTTEFNELLDNCDFIREDGTIIEDNDKKTTVNGVVGILLRSRINEATLFLACTGYGQATALNSKGITGQYWANSLANEQYPNRLAITTNTVAVANTSFQRWIGMAIRPVYDQSIV